METLGSQVQADLRQIDDILDGSERKRLIRNTILWAGMELSFQDTPDATATKQASLQTSILTLYTIATKHNVSLSDFRNFLTGLELNPESIDDLSENYAHSKEDIARRLSAYGHDIQWLSQVSWRLSSYVSGESQELLYKVSLEGAENGQRTIIAAFDCTIEQLQNLGYKFKEIERNCLKFTENK